VCESSEAIEKWKKGGRRRKKRESENCGSACAVANQVNVVHIRTKITTTTKDDSHMDLDAIWPSDCCRTKIKRERERECNKKYFRCV
jgi:hypothetical protein